MSYRLEGLVEAAIRLAPTVEDIEPTFLRLKRLAEREDKALARWERKKAQAALTKRARK